jgi:hypothetical protein
MLKGFEGELSDGPDAGRRVDQHGADGPIPEADEV